ncbi:hypothetical protein [Phaeobacter sp. CECT 5382]|nr:hypothetical protein [Phaeobacter sp. CECT 5382]
MLEIFFIAAATLAIVLYLQARQSAREIRRNLAQSSATQSPLLLHPRDH